MNLSTAKEILKRHNIWRRSEDDFLKMEDPTELGIAIETILDNIR